MEQDIAPVRTCSLRFGRYFEALSLAHESGQTLHEDLQLENVELLAHEKAAQAALEQRAGHQIQQEVRSEIEDKDLRLRHQGKDAADQAEYGGQDIRQFLIAHPVEIERTEI